MGWEARLAGSEPPGAKPLTTVAANLPGKTGSGFLSVVRNVFLLTTSFLSIASYQIPNGLAVAGSIMRSTFHLASSAPNGLPSWNVTFSRRVQTISVGLVYSHLVASAGSTARVRGLWRVKLSLTMRGSTGLEGLLRLWGW